VSHYLGILFSKVNSLLNWLWNHSCFSKICLANQGSSLTFSHTATHCNTLPHTATHCNTLHRTATHCNTLQYTANRLSSLTVSRVSGELVEELAHDDWGMQFHKVPLSTAAHCNTLQHTATHCNTKQYQTTTSGRLCQKSAL